jgi:3-demethoxyubiquinol 3-hydroxylase
MDRLIGALDGALRTLFAAPRATRPCPVVPAEETHLGARERRHAAALMRVNHVGEVCAQALYTAQALVTRDAALRRHLEQAASEETDHLAWTAQRIEELGSRTSLLNPLWYAGAFGLGLVAGRLGDPVSLGFVVETERQVEEHLQGHLERLPAGDHASRAIVAKMKEDESAHGQAALQAGAAELPGVAKLAMKAAARVMTTTAHFI